MSRLPPAALLGVCAVVSGACAASAEPARSPSAVELSPRDLCAGLVQDRDAHPMTPVDKPPLLGTVVDREFGTTIRRITAVTPSGGNPVIKPLYTIIAAWNADESYLLLYDVAGGNHRLHDGRTYQSIRNLDIAPADIEQVYWHTSDPDVLYYVDDRTLVRYHVSTSVHESVRTFTGAVCRIGRHRSWGKSNTHIEELYWAEAHMVPSPSGNRAVFASDWGNGTTVDSYVVELPGYSAGPVLSIGNATVTEGNGSATRATSTVSR